MLYTSANYNFAIIADIKFASTYDFMNDNIRTVKLKPPNPHPHLISLCTMKRLPGAASLPRY